MTIYDIPQFSKIMDSIMYIFYKENMIFLS